MAAASAEDMERFEKAKSLATTIYRAPDNSESIHEDEDGNVIAEYDDGDRGVYQHPNGTTKSDIDLQREGGKYTGGDGNYLGEQEDVLDHSTLNKNIFGHYPGPNNPTTYPDKDGNVNADFSEPPVTPAGYPAIIHDKEYGNVGAAGAHGLFLDKRTIAADYRFVKNEFTIGHLTYLSGDFMTSVKSYGLGIGLGLSALPKTLITLPQPTGMLRVKIWGEISKVKEDGK